MPSAWKIVAYRRPREIEEPSVREFYLVALPQKDAAIAVLRMRHGFDDAELEVAGKPNPKSWNGSTSSPVRFSGYRP